MFGSQGEEIDFKTKLLFVEPKCVLNNASEVLMITKYERTIEYANLF